MQNLIGHVYQTQQGIFCIDPRDMFVGKALRELGQYGLTEIQRIRSLVSSQASVLMIGGHIGSLAIPLSKFVKDLVVIEANPETYRLLDINLGLNKCSNIESYNIAANDKKGSIEFVMNTVNSGGSKRMPLCKDNMYFHDAPSVMKVDAFPLDEVLPGKRFDLIFMDIEGSEYFCMKGMPFLLKTAEYVIVEFIPHHLARVAGITVVQFLECLHEFETLIVPSKRISVAKDQFHQVLQGMFNSGQPDEGLIFVRSRVNVVF